MGQDPNDKPPTGGPLTDDSPLPQPEEEPGGQPEPEDDNTDPGNLPEPPTQR